MRFCPRQPESRHCNGEVAVFFQDVDTIEYFLEGELWYYAIDVYGRGRTHQSRNTRALPRENIRWCRHLEKRPRLLRCNASIPAAWGKTACLGSHPSIIVPTVVGQR